MPRISGIGAAGDEGMVCLAVGCVEAVEFVVLAWDWGLALSDSRYDVKEEEYESTQVERVSHRSGNEQFNK